MPNDPNFQRLLELSWKRKLTGAEQAQLQAWLAAHPEAQADWDAEASLNEALRRLQDSPVPSNFTARVLQAIELDERTNTVRSPVFSRPLVIAWSPAFRRWLPRVAVACIVFGAG